MAVTTMATAESNPKAFHFSLAELQLRFSFWLHLSEMIVWQKVSFGFFRFTNDAAPPSSTQKNVLVFLLSSSLKRVFSEVFTLL